MFNKFNEEANYRGNILSMLLCLLIVSLQLACGQQDQIIRENEDQIDVKEPDEEKIYAVIGEGLFYAHCASCHSPPGSRIVTQYTSMDDARDRFSRQFLMEIMSSGRAVMPNFQYLSEDEKEAIVKYLFNVDEDKKDN